jgi:hypothetical protein
VALHFQRVTSGASQILLLDAFLIGVLHLGVAARARTIPPVQMLMPVQPLLATSASRPDVRAALHAAHSGAHALARTALHAAHSGAHALARTTLHTAHSGAHALARTALHTAHSASVAALVHGTAALHAATGTHSLAATTLHATATTLHAATATATAATFRHRHTTTQRGNQSGNNQHILAHDILPSHERTK